MFDHKKIRNLLSFSVTEILLCEGLFFYVDYMLKCQCVEMEHPTKGAALHPSHCLLLVPV